MAGECFDEVVGGEVYFFECAGEGVVEEEHHVDLLPDFVLEQHEQHAHVASRHGLQQYAHAQPQFGLELSREVLFVEVEQEAGVGFECEGDLLKEGEVAVDVGGVVAQFEQQPPQQHFGREGVLVERVVESPVLEVGVGLDQQQFVVVAEAVLGQHLAQPLLHAAQPHQPLLGVRQDHRPASAA